MMTMVMMVACHLLADFVDMAECFWGIQGGDIGAEKGGFERMKETQKKLTENCMCFSFSFCFLVSD